MAKANPVQVEKYLGGANYPCSRDELADYAREQGADNNVIQTIQGLDRERFSSPTEVSEAIGATE